MMRSWRLHAPVWLAAVLVVQAAGAQGPALPGPGKQTAKAEQPESIFNGQVRRYRFALEGRVVTPDVAEEFVVQYQRPGKARPPIVGAYADGERDALVVVARPEAEQAIRESLAEWIVASGGIESPSLKMQRRVLEARWRVIVSGMAEVEVQLIESSDDRAQQLKDRLRSFEGELTTLERQLQVIDRYIARLAAGPSPGE